MLHIGLSVLFALVLLGQVSVDFREPQHATNVWVAAALQTLARRGHNRKQSPRLETDGAL